MMFTATATAVLTRVAQGLGHARLDLEALIAIRMSVEDWGYRGTCEHAGQPCDPDELKTAWLEWSAMATEMFAPVNRTAQ
jgi:hypothetical protein